MARKDVEDYYNKITADYMEMVESLKEMEELAAQNVVNPDKVEDLRRAVEPLKINYQRISWIMFLLNQPARKEKVERYKNSMNNKMLKIDPNKEHDEVAIRKENQKIISTLNDVWTGKTEE